MPCLILFSTTTNDHSSPEYLVSDIRKLVVPSSRFAQSHSYYFLLQVALLEHTNVHYTFLMTLQAYEITPYMGRLVCCTEIYAQTFQQSRTQLIGPCNMFNRDLNTQILLTVLELHLGNGNGSSLHCNL